MAPAEGASERRKGIDTLLARLPVVALVAAAEDVPIADDEPAPPEAIPAAGGNPAVEVEARGVAPDGSVCSGNPMAAMNAR